MEQRQLEATVKAIVRQSLAEMLGLNAPQAQPQRQWYRASEAAQRLELDSPDVSALKTASTAKTFTG